MSHIDELIKRHCPNGVEYVTLSDVADTVAGLSGKSKADFTDGNARYVSYKNIFANLAVNQDAPDFVRVGSSERQNKLRLGDVLFTGSSETANEVGMSSVVTMEPSEPLYLNSFSFALRFRDSELMEPGFSKYLFRSSTIRAQIERASSGVTRINISKGRFLKVRIPIPPTEVQKEIAVILDTFSKLEAELEAELEARRIQYAFYRDSLIAAYKDSSVPMGSVGIFKRGRRFTKNDVVADGIPSMHYGEIYTHYGVSAETALTHVRSELSKQLCFAQPGDVVIATVGETVEDVAKAVAWLGSEPIAIHDDTAFFRSEENPKYISYAMQTADFHSQKNKHVARGKVKRLSGDGLSKIQVPVPPRKDQDRIVGILDKFDALVNDLSTGLPAELNARRQQYEHYRDRLLTFQEAV